MNFDEEMESRANAGSELRGECQDVEIAESKANETSPRVLPSRSKWLDLADSICHDPYRRRK